jgi:hypothetical protein
LPRLLIVGRLVSTVGVMGTDVVGVVAATVVGDSAAAVVGDSAAAVVGVSAAVAVVAVGATVVGVAAGVSGPQAERTSNTKTIRIGRTSLRIVSSLVGF